jgi:hypothetical protein
MSSTKPRNSIFDAPAPGFGLQGRQFGAVASDYHPEVASRAQRGQAFRDVHQQQDAP